MAVNSQEIQETQEIFTLAEHLKKLRYIKADLEAQLKDVNARISEVEENLAQTMVNLEMQNFTRNGLMFYLTTKIYVNPVSERKQELFAWLKSHGYGDMVQETVNTNTLAAFVREQLEKADELPDGLGELVNVFEKTTVGMRKAPAKKKEA